MYNFNAKVEEFENSGVWSHFFRIEVEIAEKLIEGKNRRVLCSINGGKAIQCALMHGEGELYFININKEIRRKNKLEKGSEFQVELEKDDSEFGLPFPEEFNEVLDSDTEAKLFFDGLTPGKKRNLLYIVNKPKSIDKRIEKALVIAIHLKLHKGKIDFRQLNEDFRDFGKSIQ